MITIRGIASYKNIIHSPSKENSVMYTYFLIVIYLKNLCFPVLIKSCFENTLNWKQWTTSLLNSPAREHFSVTFYLCKPIFKKFFIPEDSDRKQLPCIKTSPVLKPAIFLFLIVVPWKALETTEVEATGFSTCR